ncbi:hypothetical protein [Desulfotomaculum sp. 1211_IL3151]|uniref:hypothetical protein n=1 Tax=Desulfotomaculum sp. 1211_IL3151 TaxID=3084055 RepID=UPI002FDB3360
MKKKVLLLLSLLMVVSLFFSGCGESKAKVEVKTPEEAARMEGDPVQNLTIKEKEWLARLDTVREEISKSYTGWEQGTVTKEDFMKQLNKSMDAVKQIRKDYDLHTEVNAMPNENEEVYKNSLAYGKKLRTNVNNFIFMATEGILDAETNKLRSLNDEQIKDVYGRYMIEKYDEYKAKLQPALK